MKKRILITGATGFVGFHLIEAALAKGLEVFANVRKSSQTAHLQGLGINFVELDFESIYQMAKHVQEYKYDYVIHAAAVTKAENLDQYHKYNAGYTRNLAIAVAQAAHQVEKFVFVSSLAALGPLKNAGSQLSDNGASNPVTHYGKSKALAETYLQHIDNLPWLVFRPTAVYGPREREILMVIKAINRGLEVYMGDKEQQLSFVYVKDLAQIMVSSLQSAMVNKSYNVSDGHVYGRSAFAEHARAIMQKRTFKVQVPLSLIKGIAWSLEKGYKLIRKMPTLNIDKVNELTGINWSCDIKNIKNDLGYSPQYQLQQGLEETIKWYQINKWL
ncbi:NAD(P)-dependent oxidoreductase [Pedobacter sp. HDW13]|uniref:NAD-dependent epimerase/dehydratase family protein n=1 Tax=unclassified Pedobacter TaxID=2628915 RepID=UPI000F5A7A46|nr:MULTISPECIES: NAD(P)-dependent oxidoreductase [unclassified Pedobacter]QIL38013.1 NAD(P)-dependent oxidoreductase [Pedobacter sp. HDW13]RQO68983.1 UDP-glucose 4-epimerase [Pedobacter sp. KBW01]